MNNAVLTHIMTMIAWIKTQIANTAVKGRNPFYKKLEKILGHQKYIYDYHKIYFIKRFAYNEWNYSRFKKSLADGNVKSFLDTVEHDLRKDNVELYFVEGERTKHLFVILDTFELISVLTVLDVVKNPKIKPEDFDSELVYGVV